MKKTVMTLKRRNTYRIVYDSKKLNRPCSSICEYYDYDANGVFGQHKQTIAKTDTVKEAMLLLIDLVF